MELGLVILRIVLKKKLGTLDVNVCKIENTMCDIDDVFWQELGQ